MDPNATPVAAEPIVSAMPAIVDLPEGDTVTLKDGKVLKNVQVVKTTLTEVHLQTLLRPPADLPPLVVPRKFVESITYDEYDPNTAALADAQAGRGPGVMSGFAVSKDLGEKLHAKLPPPPLSFDNRDLLDVLRDLSERVGVPIDPSNGVREMPPQGRLWTFQTSDDMTLFSLLQEKLPEKFPELTVDYQFDRVLVRTKAEGAPSGEPTNAPADAAVR